MEEIVRTRDVFKTARGLPLNYIERKDVDHKFINALSQDSHIVIYGSSKQGKTSLRKYNLDDDDYIVITCSNNWDLSDLNVAILKEAGYKISSSESETHKGTKKVRLSFDIPFINGPSAKTDLSSEKIRTINKMNLELDQADVNDIIRALKEINFEKYIVIEDFHYLPESTQVDFSVALKAFHEDSKISFIIIGVWLEEDRLTVHNGDLTGRVISISADLWCEEDFQELFRVSEAYLNISFTENFKKNLITHCNNNIFLAQQICLSACESQQIHATQEILTIVGQEFNVTNCISSILANQNSRYHKFLTEFSSGFDQTELELYKWILYVLIVVDRDHLERGIPAAAANRIITEKHPQRSNVSQRKLTQSLRRIVDLQVKSSIKPIIIEFDANTTKIKVVDKSFILWRDYQDKSDLFDFADLTSVT